MSEEDQKELVELESVVLMTDEELSSMSASGIAINSAGFVANFSQRNQLVTVSPSTSVDEVAQLLCTNHRVVVLEGEKLVGYITQADVVKYWHSKDKFSDKTVKELDIGSTAITSIREDQKVLEAYRDMAISKSRACAVVDSEGKLVGNLSALDIRGVSSTGDFMDRLYAKYSEYMTFLERDLHLSPRGAYTTTLDQPLNKLVKDMLDNKRHHVYLVDEFGKPVRVISLGDVLRFVK